VKHLAEKKTAFIPNVQLCIGFVFSMGVVACAGLLLSGMLAVAYLLNFTISICLEIGQHVWSLYDHSSTGTQLFMLFLLYCLFQAIHNRFFRARADRRRDD
jgi:hypothetical protein